MRLSHLSACHGSSSSPVHRPYNMAATIVNTLKSKIRENAEELERFQALADETRAKVETEKKLREEVESEVQSLGRKIRLLEDSVERQQDRLEMTNRNLAAATETLQSSDGGRQAIETRCESTSERIELLEAALVEAKQVAEAADRQCEDGVRKLVLAEQTRDRAEEKAGRSEAKSRSLEEELGLLARTVKNLAGSGDSAAEREDEHEDKLRELKQRISAAEVSAETSERAGLRLQKEVDILQNGILAGGRARGQAE